MKKKIIAIAVILLVITAASSFAIGIGGAFGFDPIGSSPYSGALSLKYSDWPLLGISASGNSDQFNLGLTADWWLYHEHLAGILNLYAGLGGYGVLGLGNSTNFQIGARIPVGLQIFPIDVLELFLEVAPAVGVTLGDNFSFPNWGLQSAVGFRFWF